MSFIYLFWKINDEKIKKSKRERRNILLETEVERNLDMKSSNTPINASMNASMNSHMNAFGGSINTSVGTFVADNTDFKSREDINLFNFRDNIEISIEKRSTNREILEKRLSSREKINNSWSNPFLPTNNYLEDISNEDKFLRPKNTNELNNDV